MAPASVFLVGFMCCGKTRVGRELAQLLGWRHIDLDRRIEEQVGPLQVYFAQRGEAAFRDLEREVLSGLLAVREVVISSGGGTPKSFDNMARMLEAGTVVFLDVPLGELMPRIIRSGGDRPLLMGLKGGDLELRVTTLLEERLPDYRRAHITIDASGSLVRGQTFKDLTELRALLVRDLSGQFTKNLAENLLTYAVGRGLEYSDKPPVQAVLKQSEATGHRLRDLILAVCQSVPFQRMRVP